MCDPITAVAIGGLALSAVGTATSAYSAYQAQESQNSANEYNASISRRNAEMANLNAANAIQQGQAEENLHREKVNKLIGTQRATAGASGLLVDSGTNEDYVEESAGRGANDALTIRMNAERNAYAYRNQAADYNAQATLSTMKNSSPATAGLTSLLSGGSRLAGDVYSFAKNR